MQSVVNLCHGSKICFCLQYNINVPSELKIIAIYS